MLLKEQVATLKQIDTHIQVYFAHEQSGHDYNHIKRVVNLTSRLIAIDDPQRYLALLIAYFHDVFDDKVNPTHDLKSSLMSLFSDWNLDFAELTEDIINGVAQIGYKGGYGVRHKTYAAQYVSDADILDSMGAMGIARTFYYAGSKGTPLYDPKLENVTYTTEEEYRSVQRNAIAHFDEKLLKLIDWIETPKAKVIAAKRHALMDQFYVSFYDEVAESDI
ncbi:phosphohydrolase [Erysipelothrix sp. HDW6C]|uniref:HD domain-containing protein n=1 Tax=Erysipelothrix sp. HDW6C TaxID=2714930 RepID=UPI00140A7632|nr:phosphohydrolase [Erysipelothrix sp. HDW6C]QIK69944.1 phosphohydrolase [Erysipelothrix sp. HDW6C]